MKHYLLKNPKKPHWTPQQEAQIAIAERCGTRAEIYELGCAEYMKTRMPCAQDIEEIVDVLGNAIAERKRGAEIMFSATTLTDETLQPSPRSRKPRTTKRKQAAKS